MDDENNNVQLACKHEKHAFTKKLMIRIIVSLEYYSMTPFGSYHVFFFLFFEHQNSCYVHTKTLGSLYCMIAYYFPFLALSAY